MNVGDSSQHDRPHPGHDPGVLYDGMTADGSKVFFTTADQLTGADDTDTSADIYEADVGRAASATLTPGLDRHRRAPGNTDSCEPVGQHRSRTLEHDRLRRRTAASSRSAAAAESPPATARSTSSRRRSSTAAPTASRTPPTSTSPAPGYAPHFVATLESSANAPLPPADHPFAARLRLLHQAAPGSRSITPTATSTCSTSATPKRTGDSSRSSTPRATRSQASATAATERHRYARRLPPATSTTTELPTQIAVDNDPVEPLQRRPLRPRHPSTASSTSSTPSGNLHLVS